MLRDGWLEPSEIRALRLWGEEQIKNGRLAPARIGLAAENREDIRGDRILWLTPDDAFVISRIWQKFEHLQRELAEGLLLGLHHFEVHLALYPPGSAYQAHIDQARSAPSVNGRRVISMVSYLNDDWTEEDGGELCLLDPENPSIIRERILPQAGRMVLFRSDTILHEVRAPRRERWSLTGWFRSS